MICELARRHVAYARPCRLETGVTTPVKGARGYEMEFNVSDTAVVITDPQNDFLSPDGVTWELVGESVTENRTVEHLEQLIRAAKDRFLCHRTITSRRITAGSSVGPLRI